MSTFIQGPNCALCIHQQPVPGMNQCMRPEVVAMLDHEVLGELVNSGASCEGAREFASVCGHMGRYFEARPK